MPARLKKLNKKFVIATCVCLVIGFIAIGFILTNAKARRETITLGVNGRQLNLTIAGRNLFLSPMENSTRGLKPKIVPVPLVQTIQIENDLANLSDWPSAIRKMTTVCNPSLFLKNTLVVGSLAATVSNTYIPTPLNTGVRYGPDNLTSNAFQSVLNEQYIKVLGFDKEIGHSQSAIIRYKAKAQRLDTLTINQDGELKLELGTPTELAPVPPKISEHELPLANILAKSDALGLDESDIFPIFTPIVNDASNNSEQPKGCLRKVCGKLRDGKPLRILFYGDSITCGGSVEDPKFAFYNLFTEALKKEYPRSAITAVNKGLGGTATNTRVPRFNEEVLIEQPDLLIVEFVNNFALSKEETERDYDKILTQAKAHGIDVILCTPHLFAPNYFPKSYGMKTWEMVANHPYVEQIRGFAKRYHTGLADIARRWGRLQPEGLTPALLLTDKLLHVNESGHEIYADELLKCVRTEVAGSESEWKHLMDAGRVAEHSDPTTALLLYRRALIIANASDRSFKQIGESLCGAIKANILRGHAIVTESEYQQLLKLIIDEHRLGHKLDPEVDVCAIDVADAYLISKPLSTREFCLKHGARLYEYLYGSVSPQFSSTLGLLQQYYAAQNRHDDATKMLAGIRKIAEQRSGLSSEAIGDILNEQSPSAKP
jgi:lysophospholipase L1-like esterase